MDKDKKTKKHTQININKSTTIIQILTKNKSDTQININKSTTILQILTKYKSNDKIQQCYYCRRDQTEIDIDGIYICSTCCDNFLLK